MIGGRSSSLAAGLEGVCMLIRRDMKGWIYSGRLVG